MFPEESEEVTVHRSPPHEVRLSEQQGRQKRSRFQRRVRHQRIISSSPRSRNIPSHINDVRSLSSFMIPRHLFGDISLISCLSKSTETHLHR